MKKNYVNNRLVIDSSVYITYGIFGKLYRIAYTVEQYSLQLFVNRNLLEEVEKNLKGAATKKVIDVEDAMRLICEFSTEVETVATYTQSPDPKDNFLFDIAIQTDSDVIVSQEKALLQFAHSPVPVHDIKWFKEKYPVRL
jgi:uncharacterized protein